jgi:hypothetical protein
MHFIYLVGEVEKRDLLMVSLEWMMHIVGGMHCWWVEYSVTGGEIGLGRGPHLNSTHCQRPTSATLACLFVEVF